MRDEIETKRLLLREFTYSDGNYLNEFFNDHEATRYIQGTKNPVEIKKWLSLVILSYKQNGFGPWAIISKDGGHFIGYCGLYLQNCVDGKDEIEILYGLIKRHWGKGYATEAAKKAYSFGKSEYQIHRFISLIVPENKRSIKVSLNLGMSFEKECNMWNKTHHLYSIESY